MSAKAKKVVSGKNKLNDGPCAAQYLALETCAARMDVRSNRVRLLLKCMSERSEEELAGHRAKSEACVSKRIATPPFKRRFCLRYL